MSDIQRMYEQLGKTGAVPDELFDRVINDLKGRFKRAQSERFLPTVSYSRISFSGLENEAASPWGQAFTFLNDLAELPRKAITDPFFFRGLQVPEGEYLSAMNVADDIVYRESGARVTKQEYGEQLSYLKLIPTADLEPREKCERVLSLIRYGKMKSVAGIAK